jgi:VanZ family protein
MKIVAAWIPALIWMILIFLLSSRQRIAVSEEYVVNFLIFKTLHIIEYAILFFFYVRGLHYPLGMTKWRFATAFVLAVLYAISDEVHQSFVPTREGKLRDVIIDAIGALLAWSTLTQFVPILPTKLKKWATNWLFL